MNNVLADTTITTVAGSLQTLQNHRRDLCSAMQGYLARWNSSVFALPIMDMLFDHALASAGRSNSAQIEETACRHRLIGVTLADYSFFGDGLGAVMKDVLGAEAVPSTVAAWVDTYWAIVRSVRARTIVSLGAACPTGASHDCAETTAPFVCVRGVPTS